MSFIPLIAKQNFKQQLLQSSVSFKNNLTDPIILNSVYDAIFSNSISMLSRSGQTIQSNLMQLVCTLITKHLGIKLES